jgi:hypothetical protein
MFAKHLFIGAVGLIWFSIWWIVVKGSPEEDPRISPQELKYILDSLGNTSPKVCTLLQIVTEQHGHFLTVVANCLVISKW